MGPAPCHLFSSLCNIFKQCPQPWHSAEPFPCLSQIVLAFGNYMNSSKRGAAYGFRLQSLDAVRRGPWLGGWGWGLAGGLWLTTGPCAAVGDEVD